jgi:tetratricopeptide (TPR) repeat protein
MFQRFRYFLGEERFRLLIALLAITGIASTVMAFIDAPYSLAVQTILATSFMLAAVWIIAGRVDAETRNRWLAVIAPALGLVTLSLLFFPDQLGLFLGAAFGWTLVGLLVFGRNRAPMQYRLAIKAMRKGEYQEAVNAMNELIKAEPDEANHYRFRAELLRMWGKLGRARRDYEQMLALQPDSPVAYNGLAEVDLQAKAYDRALESAQRAYELAPEEWVAAYNLGMIQDRLQASQDVVQHLEGALSKKVPDARHRLLMRLYLVRAYARLGDESNAKVQLDLMQKEQRGLQEWQTILESDQADTLRAVLAEPSALSALVKAR